MHCFRISLLFLAALFRVQLAVAEDEGKTWCVLMVGVSSYRYTYAMEGAVYRMYNVLLDGGIPAENIIVLSPDIAAFHYYNINPGMVTHSYPNDTIDYAPSYAENVVVDYAENISPKMFEDILSGNENNVLLKEMGSGRVVKSGPKDTILIYYNGFGYYGSIWLNNRYSLYAETFIPFLEDLKDNNKFNKMLFVLEAHNAGSMFDDYIDTNKDILVYAFGGRYNEMYLCDFNRVLGVYTSYCGGRVFHKYLEMMLSSASNQKETIFDTFVNSRLVDLQAIQPVHNLYGTLQMGMDRMNNYLGKLRNTTAVPMNLELLRTELNTQNSVLLKEKLTTDPSILRPKERARLNKIMKKIIKKSLNGTNIEYETILEMKPQVPLKKNRSCVTKAYRIANSNCFTPRNRFMLLLEADKFANLCHLKVPKEKIISAINYYCPKR